MIKLFSNGVYLINNTDIVEDCNEVNSILKNKLGDNYPSKENAKKNTIAYNILKKHNTSENMDKLKIKFDKLASHDITFVGIIQTARASGLEKFPVPYALTNCHNSLCAVGGTINEDDHMFGLSCVVLQASGFAPSSTKSTFVTFRCFSFVATFILLSFRVNIITAGGFHPRLELSLLFDFHALSFSLNREHGVLAALDLLPHIAVGHMEAYPPSDRQGARFEAQSLLLFFGENAAFHQHSNISSLVHLAAFTVQLHETVGSIFEVCRVDHIFLPVLNLLAIHTDGHTRPAKSQHPLVIAFCNAEAVLFLHAAFSRGRIRGRRCRDKFIECNHRCPFCQ